MRQTFTLLGPFLFLGFYIALVFFIRGKIPDTPTLISIIQGLYGTLGYPLITLGALSEATFLLGFYVPGSTVVLLGAALSKTGIVAFPLVYILGTSGLLGGFIINYFLGRYGWYHFLKSFGLEKGIEEAQARIAKHGTKAILIGYFFPGSASFLSTAAGVLRMPFQKFLVASFIAQSFWSLLWGSLAYFFGLPLVEFVLKNFIFVLIAIGAVFFIRKFMKR